MKETMKKIQNERKKSIKDLKNEWIRKEQWSKK